MTKVAIYARTSTHLQATGLEAQLHALKTYCASKGIADFAIYSDAGVSGAKCSRPALDQLLADIKDKKIDTVITYSLSRLSRSTGHLLTMMQLFDDMNINFYSLSESIDLKSATGKLILTVLAAVSQLEREITVERVKNGLVNARQKGKILGAPKKYLDKVNIVQHLSGQSMSQDQISKLTGVSQSTISRILNHEYSKTSA